MSGEGNQHLGECDTWHLRAVSTSGLQLLAVMAAPPSPSLKFITAVKSKEAWDEEVMKAPATTLVVCDIYAKWTGPCIALNKRVANLSGDYIEYARALCCCS